MKLKPSLEGGWEKLAINLQIGMVSLLTKLTIKTWNLLELFGIQLFRVETL